MIEDAKISDCGQYRYMLKRIWEQGKPLVLFICLNPSTADVEQDDPTVRKCISLARDLGYGGLIMANLFAFRATKPKDLKSARNPVGPENDAWLRKLRKQASVVEFH